MSTIGQVSLHSQSPYLLGLLFLFSQCASDSKQPVATDAQVKSEQHVKVETDKSEFVESDSEPVKAEDVALQENVKPTFVKVIEQPEPKKKSKPKPKRKKRPKPKISFELIRFEFDTLVQGESIYNEFKFVNNGGSPLVINNVDVTCGCTQPSYPFVPIEPGETGFIGVKYSSVGKEGMQKPLIKVNSNATKEPVTLMMTGYVLKPEKPESQDSIDSESLIDTTQSEN